jgi:hypothetical protein
MTSRTFDELVGRALDAPFVGWDFAWIEGRGEEEQPPWSYHRGAA